MRKKRISPPTGIITILILAFAIGYPAYIALDRLPFLLEGGNTGLFSFFTGLPVIHTSADISPDTQFEKDDVYIFSPDEGAIPYISPVTTRSDGEIPPDDAEEMKTITISSKLEPKNNPELPFDQASLLEAPICFDKSRQTILIIHSHGSESYNLYRQVFWSETDDVRTTDTSQNVISVGRVLYDELVSLGFHVTHDETLCDRPYNASYKTALALIEQHMQSDPSIGMVLDLHRDSLTSSDGLRYKVISSDGKYAQMMFVVGSNKLLSHDGWQSNLSFALHLQSDLMERVPGLMRPISISKNRYNQHATPLSLIVECGTEANTLSEAQAGIRLLAHAIERVITP